MSKKSEKFQAEYEKEVDNAIEKLKKKVSPLLHTFCEKYGLEFLAGNGVYSFHNADYGITFAGSWPYSSFVSGSTADNRWLVDYFDQNLSDLLEIDLGQCSLGCQMDNYAPSDIQEGAYICVNEMIDPEESEVRIQDNPSDDPSFHNYGPISKQLASDIYTAYKKDNDVGLRLILGCLQKK